jgi:hypothetical protein
MGPNRNEDRVRRYRPRRQAGITAIGFLALAFVFGVLGMAGIKVVPLYLKKLSLDKVLQDVERELQGSGKNAQGIRYELESRFYVEGLDIPRKNVSISQVRNGYEIHVQQENRTQFMADLWFLVLVDEKVEIRR